MRPLAVYDWKTRKRVAFLQNAYNVKYKKGSTALWSSSFTMPSGDYKNKFCQPFNLVEVWDIDHKGNSKYVGLFRLLENDGDILTKNGDITYSLEHVFGTLMDDSLIRKHNIGNKGPKIKTKDAIQYIIDKQTPSALTNKKNWALGDCDYSREFGYEWDGEILLSALLNIPKEFAEDYYWKFNTEIYPWIFNLKKAILNNPVVDIRYKKNISGITKKVSASGMATRIYPYGKKPDPEEGEERPENFDETLTIADVNNGVEYLESPSAIEKYGVISLVWKDDRYRRADNLKEAAQKMLNKLDHPQITYKLDILMFKQVASLDIGDPVRVIADDIDEVYTVQEIEKENISENPYEGTITIGTGTIDLGIISKSIQ